MVRTIRRRRRWGCGSCRARSVVLAAAAFMGWNGGDPVLANGTFDGDEVSLSQIRQWTVPGPNPGLNWGLDTLPTPIEGLSFTSNGGDGFVDLGGATQTHPSLIFGSWTSYTLFNGTLSLSGATFTVLSNVEGTYGSTYFADGNTLMCDLSLTGPTTVNFITANSGALRLAGQLYGAMPLTLSTVPAAVGNHGVYFDMPNGGFSGPVSIGYNTSARLIGPGRPGVGAVNLDGGEMWILSDLPPGEFVPNPVNSAVGTVRADHDYASLPTPLYAPGITHTLGPVMLDNPAMLGGVPDASITFEADNGYNFSTPALTLANGVAMPGALLRVVTVNNGQRYDGYAGGNRLTGPNRLEEQVVTVTVGPAGLAGPALMDFNPGTGLGFALDKMGTGVLEINGDNQVTSTGNKNIMAGVIRFNMPTSYGTTTGLIGGPAVPVVLAGGPAPVSAGMGIGYPDPAGVPANLITTGVIAGQSGAIDIDFAPNPVPVALTTFNPFVGALTALRIGSSGIGIQAGPIAPWTDAIGDNYTYLGGGGGVLDVAAPIGFGPGPGANWIEMGTTGNLLPGRVNLLAPIGLGPLGGTLIRAGTLGALPPGVLGASPGTSLGAYSTGIDTGCNYVGAPPITPYDGPGMLLLDDVAQAGGLYFYGPGGAFGAAGLMLDGGAIGWDGPVPVPVLPGVYGAPLASSLYQSATIPAAPIATNILHMGGEDSVGAMVVGFPITDNFATFTPVALVKSGVNSTLDLTFAPVNPYTGGTGIMGGTILINTAGQLGPGAVVIADGGTLAIAAGGPPGPAVFTQPLRVANGVQRRASTIDVAPGLFVQFNGATSPGLLALEADVPGSILQATGGGLLQLYSTALPLGSVATAANTWGLKPTAGSIISINHLPGIATPANGQAVFDGGMIDLVDPLLAPMGIPIPAAIQYSPNYGFGAISTYAGSFGTLNIQNNAFFRVTGGQRGEWMGALWVQMGPNSVLQLASDPTGESTRGTGVMWINGGNVQMSPTGPNRIIPGDTAFTLGLNGNVLFSGGPGAAGQFVGNLLFNSFPGSLSVQVDGATVSTAPASLPATWVIAGTGLTDWNALVIKTQTEAVPGAGGPYTSGTVNFSRSLGAPVIVQPGATLRIDFGVINAGGSGDPFLDNSGGATTGNRVNVENNSSGPGVGVPPALGFNVASGSKNVGSLTVTGFSPAAPALGTSASAVYPGAALSAYHVRQSRLDVGGGVVIVANGSTASTSRVNTLNIAAGGVMDLNDNDLLIDYAGATPIAAVRGYLAAGQLISSTAIASTTPKMAVGYRDNFGLAVFSGQAVDPSTLLVAYCLAGDATLDGKVNTIDFNNLAGSFGSGAGNFWINGDFDYNGLVDSVDYNVLVGNYGYSFAVGAGATLGAVVPEPISGVIALMLMSLARRRRL